MAAFAEKDTTAYISKQALDAFLGDAAEKGFIGVIGISNSNGTLHMFGVGDAVRGQNPYDDETIVDIASITKQFTGAAILKLREQGKLDLDDRLDKYFDHLPEDKKAITLHQLLTHTAGMPDMIGRDETPINRKAYLDRAFDAPLIAKPGHKYQYSNAGYSVLAAIIEIASTQPFEDYLFENLWQPAGMFTTGYHRPDWRGRTIPRLEKPYKGLYTAKDILDLTAGQSWNLYGGGGVLSTTEDMLKWHRALLGNTLLSSQSRNLLMTAHVPEDNEGIYHYGYGWSVVPNYHGQKLVWHNGGSYFSRAEFWRFPETGHAVFVATHDRAIEPYYLAKGLAAILRGETPTPIEP